MVIEVVKEYEISMNMMFGLNYKVFGSSKTLLVVDCALGSCNAEWWHIAEELSRQYKILLYDRAGYGHSKFSVKERNPENIVTELKQLIDYVRANEKLILIGHSQGGYNVSQYAVKYKNEVDGLILLDPATPYDGEFKNRLSAKEFKKSGVDKTKSLKLQKQLAHIGIIKLFKGALKKQQPLCYYEYSKQAEKYIIQSLFNENTYQTAIDEYLCTHNDKNTQDLKNAINNAALGMTPVMLLTHSSEIYINELMKYAHMDLENAKKIETVWQELMYRYKNISNNSKHITANQSGHFIHLTDLELLKTCIERMALM